MTACGLGERGAARGTSSGRHCGRVHWPGGRAPRIAGCVWVICECDCVVQKTKKKKWQKVKLYTRHARGHQVSGERITSPAPRAVPAHSVSDSVREGAPRADSEWGGEII
eukprot:scaffold39552_cov40-Phaeocystis_antarctica.AAC.2